MGANQSSVSSNMRSEIIDSSYRNCPSSMIKNPVNIDYVNFVPPSYCTNSNPNDDHSTGTEAICLIASLKERLANTVHKLSPSAQQELGIRPSHDITDTKNQIDQLVDNICRQRSDTTAANVRDTAVMSCDFHFVNNATKKSSCVINALQNMTMKIPENSDTAYRDFVSIFIAAMLVFGIVYYTYVLTNSNFSNNISCWVVAFIVIAILLYSVINIKYEEGPITRDDLHRFKETIKTARTIADINNSASSDSSPFNTESDNPDTLPRSEDHMDLKDFYKPLI